MVYIDSILIGEIDNKYTQTKGLLIHYLINNLIYNQIRGIPGIRILRIKLMIGSIIRLTKELPKKGNIINIKKIN